MDQATIERLTVTEGPAPFPNGTAYMDWSARNCERCASGRPGAQQFEEFECEIECALALGSITGAVPQETADRMGCNQHGTPFRCLEFEENARPDDHGGPTTDTRRTISRRQTTKDVRVSETEIEQWRNDWQVVCRALGWVDSPGESWRRLTGDNLISALYSAGVNRLEWWRSDECEDRDIVNLRAGERTADGEGVNFTAAVAQGLRQLLEAEHSAGNAASLNAASHSHTSSSLRSCQD